MRAKGIDISHWQETFKYKDNIDFIIIKATEGWGWVDPKLEEFMPEVLKVPIRGAYHYFRTEFDPVLQAKHFWETTKDLGFHFLAVDYEAAYNVLDQRGAENLKKFWDNLKTLTDLPLFLYTNPYILRDKLIAFESFFKSVSLWIAHYNSKDPETGYPTVFSAPGWLLWQYKVAPEGKKYGVGSLDVDLNVFNGTVEQMCLWLGIQEEENNDMKKVYESKINWSGLIIILIAILQLVQQYMEAGDFSTEGIATLIMGILVIIFRTFFTDTKIEL